MALVVKSSIKGHLGRRPFFEQFLRLADFALHLELVRRESEGLFEFAYHVERADACIMRHLFYQVNVFGIFKDAFLQFI